MTTKTKQTTIQELKATGKQENERKKLVQYREQTQTLLLKNPNYFGTLTGAITEKYPEIVQLGDQKKYFERLGCIDYNPDTKILGTSVIIKQASGYSGSPCSGGSKEYVRFFVDYDNTSTWVDEGLAEIGVYDHGFGDDLCYYASITLTPDKTRCCKNTPVLPKVRTILSWNQIPDAGDSDFSPIWGEVKESYIQIAPRNSLWCHILEKLKDYPEFKIDWPEIWKPDFEEKFLPELHELLKDKKIPTIQHIQPAQLKKNYGGTVSEARIAYPYLKAMAKNYSTNTGYVIEKTLPDFDISSIIDIHLKAKFDTTYEELQCVSLDRDRNRLHAAIQIKRTSGYSGNLCTSGSKEYVAFYMDFGCGWEYMGTSDITVHDIVGLPIEGLWYDVVLDVNLDTHRKEWCEVGKAKVRGILSWSTPPNPNDPDYVSTWGDWEESNVEIKPLPEGVTPGISCVVLEKCGGMVVSDIDNATGLGTYSKAGSLAGFESPFYGTMELIGHLFFAGPGCKYRFLVTQPGGIEHPILDPQVITTDTLGVFNDVTLNPDAEGWIDYLETDTVNIVGGLLGRYGAYNEGMYTLRMEAKDGWGNPISNPNGAVRFLVDNKAPVLSIDLNPPTGAVPGTIGNCADFVIPETITGTYSISDAHCSSFNIYVTPVMAAPHNAVVHVDGNPVSGYRYDGLGTPLSLPNTGKSGTFEIFTNNMPKCGYNVRIDAIDRTIVNSHVIGFWNYAAQGFCLRKS